MEWITNSKNGYSWKKSGNDTNPKIYNGTCMRITSIKLKSSTLFHMNIQKQERKIKINENSITSFNIIFICRAL
jgi:hypothetical protein